MAGSGVRAPRAPRYRIERVAHGYRVAGPGLLIWGATLSEAIERREELETGTWRYRSAASIGGAVGAPFESIVYGPVESRRLGHSLGLNLTPAGCRVCTFACVYCTYPRTPAPARRAARWPTAQRVETDLKKALANVGALDSITISGHGEPTLHPCFPEIVGGILAAARRARPRVPVRILTNGSRAVRSDVRRALDRLDERIVKLDADAERVCRPTRAHPLGTTLFGVARLRDVTLQSCFVEGAVSNTDERALRDWIDVVAEIRPRAVQIYTIDRRPGRRGAKPVPASQLEEIACHLRARTGIEARVYG